MESILARAKKAAEEAELYSVSLEETPVQFEANRLKHIQSKQSTSLALRVIKKGRIGYATSTGVDSENLVDMAVETAQFGMKAEYEFPQFKSYPAVEIYDSAAGQVSIEKMTQLGEEVIARLRSDTPELICEGGVTKGVITVKIANSKGGEASYQESIFGIGIEGQLIRGTDMLFVGESQSSCHPILDTTDITSIILKQLELARGLATVATKSMPVIFTPQGVASALVFPLMSAFNGKVVLEGASPIGKKLGQQVFGETLWLSDDPLVAYHPSSRPCDDEGVPSQRTPLIEHGVVANFLYDLQTASRAHTRSTGSAHRSQGGMPTPSPTAFIINPGKVTFDEMVSGIKEGLIVEQLIGASQGNTLGGDFSGNVLLGYKIENGKVVGRVKNTMVSGNIYQLLKQIAAIGSDARWVGSFLHTPSLFFPGVSVASK